MVTAASLCRQTQPPIGDSNTLVLDVTVIEKAGQPVAGLQQQDFTVLDEKTPQKVIALHPVEGIMRMPNPPVQAILVLDEVNTSFQWVANERQEIEKFVGRDNGKLPLPMSLVFFTDRGTQIENNSTSDGTVLVNTLKQHEASLRTVTRAQGFYGAGDRFELSLRTLDQLAQYEAARPGRKLVIWVSPGWPLLSGPNVTLTSKQQNELFQSIVQTTAALRQARITLYSVDPLGTADAGSFRTFYWEQFTKGVRKPSQVQIGNLALQVFASQTGGQVLTSSNDVAGEIAKCVLDARTYYELTLAALPADGPNDYHSISVKVNRPDTVVRTLTGYYAQPDTHARQ